VSPNGRADAPSRSLKGFERVHLAPGEEKTVAFELEARDVAFADAKGVMQVTPADLGIWVGGGQPGKAAGQSATLHTAKPLALQP